jgi:23S rRNA (uracil1939-C5)-methyltransferase
LLPATTEAIARTLATLGPRADVCDSLILSENADATERVVHLAPRDQHHLDVSDLQLPDGLTGVTARAGRRMTVAGQPYVSDTASRLLDGRGDVPPETTWMRGPESFFQANRCLTGALLSCVLEHGRGARTADLYAGVGLFAVAFASSGADVLAVEGDSASARDLATNARQCPSLATLHGSVEDATSAVRSHRPEIVVVDPPRAGLSRLVLAGILAASARRVVYVSCDPATLARDAAGLVAGGYDLCHIEAFDMFPNTAHVETVAVFDRR